MNQIHALAEGNLSEEAGNTIAANCLADISDTHNPVERLRLLVHAIKALSCIKDTDRAVEGFALMFLGVVEIGLLNVPQGVTHEES